MTITAASPQRTATRHKAAILTIILVSYFMILLDNSVIFTALPSLQADLDLSAAQLAWVQDAYTLGFGGFLLLGARAGDNPDRITSEAAFAHLCGVAPVPASSGRVQRHRLNRGGDRQANTALYMVVINRLRYDPRSRAYAERRTQEGLSKPEIIRCLKRYVAREIYNVLCHLRSAQNPVHSALASA